MCMTIPGRVLSVDSKTATVDFLGTIKKADCSLVPCKPGEYVIVNAGFVVEIVPEGLAKQNWKLIRDGNS